MGYVSAGSASFNAADFQQSSQAAANTISGPAPIRLQPTVITVTPPAAKGPTPSRVAALQEQAVTHATNYVTPPPPAPAQDHTMLYVAGAAALLAGVFLMKG
jgi:hypothetical protein